MALSLRQRAAQASGRSRMCAKCPILAKRKICSEEVLSICHNAYIAGYIKGYKEKISNK